MHILVIQWMNWRINLESRQVAHVFKFRSSVAAQWESPAAEVASASTSWTSTVLDIGCRMTMVIYCLIGTGTVLIAKKYGTFLVYLEIQQAEYGPWGPTVPEFTADFPRQSPCCLADVRLTMWQMGCRWLMKFAWSLDANISHSYWQLSLAIQAREQGAHIWPHTPTRSCLVHVRVTNSMWIWCKAGELPKVWCLCRFFFLPTCCCCCCCCAPKITTIYLIVKRQFVSKVQSLGI